MASYFPNAYNYDPEDIKKKLSAPRLDRSQLTTYTLPSGGQVSLPIGSKLPSYYQNTATPYVPPRTAAQQFDLNQAYAQGYGAPSPTIQQGAGGPYRIAGGVAAPIQKPLFPNIFNNPAGNAVWNAGARGLSSIGNLASNIFSGIGNAATRAFNPDSYTQTGVSPFSPNTQSYANRGPNRYFDY